MNVITPSVFGATVAGYITTAVNYERKNVYKIGPRMREESRRILKTAFNASNEVNHIKLFFHHL
jgi:hypothetical protein